MLLVCDSGSTKADWLVAENGKVAGGFETMGFNPFFHDAETVFIELNKSKEALQFREKAGQIFFYGAGCSSDDRNKIIADGLQRFFIRAEVHVDHDMLGAALASCGNEAGLVCILGTGSNIAFYDGKNLSETIHGIGYIMGDESSGSYYGKKLIAYFLYRIMPPDLSRTFFEKYRMTKELMIENVYRKPHANVYLASFARFLSDHRQHPWIMHLVKKGMTEFFETNISSYPEYKSHPVHFIGSIAHHFSETLHEVAGQCGFTVGKILVKPVKELMEYFISNKT